MNIKEVEARTGLQRSNIRFYEREGLVTPERNPDNGYRDYSDKNVEDIKRIAYLRTLGIPIEDIRRIINAEVPMRQVIEKQVHSLELQISGLSNAKELCEIMLRCDHICFDNLDIERFVTDKEDQWTKNQNILKRDSVGFLFLWGGTVTWLLITLLSLMIAAIAYPALPDKIPIQWSGSAASSYADKHVILIYPLACVIVRFLLRPFIWRWLQLNYFYCDFITNYATNSICVLGVSVQIFTILFVYGILQNIAGVLLTAAVVLAGLFIINWRRLSKEMAGSCNR